MAIKVLPGEMGYIVAWYEDGRHCYPGIRYPWEQWSDGNVWHLRRGEGDDADYRTDQAIINAAQQYAHRHNLRLQRRKSPTGYYIRFTPRETATTP